MLTTAPGPPSPFHRPLVPIADGAGAVRALVVRNSSQGRSAQAAAGMVRHLMMSLIAC